MLIFLWPFQVPWLPPSVLWLDLWLSAFKHVFKLIQKIKLRVSRQVLLSSGLRLRSDKQQHTEIHGIQNAGLLLFSSKFSLSHWTSQPETLLRALILSIGYPVFTPVNTEGQSTEGQSTFFTWFQTHWPASSSSRGNYVLDRRSIWGQEMMQRHLLCSLDTASTIYITIRSVVHN